MLFGKLNDSNRIKESLENINVDGSKMECDCVNSWLQGAEFNNGYDCDDANNEVTECAPKVAKDGYNFEFPEDTSQSAIVSESVDTLMCDPYTLVLYCWSKTS